MNLSTYFNYENGFVTYGLTDELIAFYVLELFKQKNENVILVTSNLYESNKLFNLIKTYTDDCSIFPMDDFVTSAVIAMSPEFKLGRLNVLERLSHKKEIIITNLMGYLKYLPNKKINNNINLTKDIKINREDFINKLTDFGYKRETMVTTTGEFSVRGFMIDVYLVNEVHPVRIEFFGNDIESIRYFDENTQRTLEEINKIIIKPFEEIETFEKSSLYDYSNNGIVVYLNKEQINLSYEKINQEFFSYQENNNSVEKFMFDLDEIKPKYELYIDTINNPSDFVTYSIPAFNEDLELLKDNVFKWEKEGKEVYFYLTKEREIKNIKSLIPNAKIVNMPLNKGFIIDKYVCISEEDIGIHVKKDIKYINNLRIGKKIKSYNDLEKGDYVVHINHGIGIYNGLVTLTKDGL